MTSGSPHINRWRAFAVLAVAYFMTIVDLTIVNVSLPTIGRDLHFSATSLQWVVTAYALTFGGFLLLGGRPPLGWAGVEIEGQDEYVVIDPLNGTGALFAGSVTVLPTFQSRRSSRRSPARPPGC